MEPAEHEWVTISASGARSSINGVTANPWLGVGSIAGHDGDVANFAGTINLAVRDSVPDWSAFAAKPAPAGAPNVLVIRHADLDRIAANA